MASKHVDWESCLQVHKIVGVGLVGAHITLSVSAFPSNATDGLGGKITNGGVKSGKDPEQRWQLG